MHMYLQSWQFIFHSENTTIEVSLVALFYYLTVIRHLNYLKIVNINLWKTMYRTNTKNANKKLNVFKAEFVDSH